MARYIDADALLSRLPDDLPYKGSVKRVLLQAPTEDVVEVVRCKDCEWSRRMVSGEYSCLVDHRLSHEENDFCSYGERKLQRESDSE